MNHGMGADRVGVDGFEFWTGKFDGHRLVEVRFPEKLRLERLSTIIDPFYSLWDADTLTVQIVDASPCEGLDDAAHEFFKVLIRRTVHQRAYWATSWIVGNNRRIERDVTHLLADAVHTTEGIVSSRAEAEAFLKEYCRRPPNFDT